MGGFIVDKRRKEGAKGEKGTWEYHVRKPKPMRQGSLFEEQMPGYDPDEVDDELPF